MARQHSPVSLSMFALKIIAVVAMLSSHIVIVFRDKFSQDTALWMYYIGRLAFPIFAFTIANGWHRTHNKLFYILRILAMAVVSQIPFTLSLYSASFDNFKSFFISSPLNIGFTFLLAMLSLWIFDLLRKMSFPKVLSAVCAFIPAFLFETLTPFHVDYGYFGVLLILVMYITMGDDSLMLLSSVAVFAAMCATFGDLVMTVRLDVFLCYIASAVLLMFYNGRMGAKSKYAFYIFYPAHLLVLYLLNMAI
ncbi:MAG: hypothetical protein IJO61_05395 [Oscillospiraceae bacterium]|nr:hypothetical protein [Oscillospiraceae bacterium]